MQILIILVFIVGYILIAAEHGVNINKAASAILTAVVCWTIYIFFQEDKELVNHQLTDHLGEVSGILFFLMAAMTIVELIDLHDGFQMITQKINAKDKRSLMWIISFLTFFLSAVLDNLTTTIVMISLLRKLISKREDRLMFAGMIVIAANAGGAWSPIGDVTTTMLWIGKQITTSGIIVHLILPSLVCLLVPLLLSSFIVKGEVEAPILRSEKSKCDPAEQKLVLGIGISALLFVPVFKTITHLPPFFGILFGLAVLWIVTELIHHKKEDEHKNKFSVLYALQKIDTPSILFFLGILLTISALNTSGILTHLANYLDRSIGNYSAIAIIIGFLSAIIDNVPLVAAAQGMYDLQHIATDHSFWKFLAYTAGTGGSCLIIGSAAGVAAMGMENISFIWYLKKISWIAAVGYIAGCLVYLLQNMLLS